MRVTLSLKGVKHLQAMPAAKRAPKTKTAETYVHPEADSPMRPEVGTQAQFKKKKPPQTYRYDSSLSPELAWDGQNPAREQGEAAIREARENLTKANEDLQQFQRCNP